MELNYSFLICLLLCILSANSLSIPLKNNTDINILPDIASHPNLHLIPTFPNCGTTLFEAKSNRDNEHKPHGNHTRVRRVVAGLLARKNQFPWVVEVHSRAGLNDSDENYECTGTLINSRYVITTADAFSSEVTRSGHQRIASHIIIPSALDNEKKYYIEKMITHEDMDYALRNNIVLIRLAEPVDFDEYVQPICLPLNGTNYVQNIMKPKLSLIGFGRNGPFANASSPGAAHYAFMKILPSKNCDRVYSYKLGILTDESICARSTSFYKDGGICSGDGGAPLVLETMETKYNTSEGHVKKFTQIGMSSYIPICGKEGFPGVFVNVGSYVKWMLDNIED